jgi:general secretion pathway protein C
MQLNQVIDWLQGPRAEHTARAVALLLGVWVLYRLAVVVWQVVPAPPLPEAVLEPPAPAAVGATARQRVDISTLVNWHLFGASGGPAAPTGSAPIDAPETRLNLVLRGVLSSGDPESAGAIIAEPNGNENFFRIGSALPGGAELVEIYPDRIILKRAGQHETLRLPRDGLEGPAPQTRARPPAPGAAAPAGPAENAGAVLAEYRQRMAENPQSLLDLARPVPYNDANGFAGFRLFPGNNPALFGQLGLQPGDLVKAVNGIVLDSAVRGAEAMQSLAEASQLNLRIERAGQEIDLSVDIP